ncbi:MAG: hypothetical protein KY476_23800 [Planctomycetes bacterium]|nr:hypothetical protein [Planctomycetota bacterium]
MNWSEIGPWLGPAIGGVLGLAGGIVGTWLSIRNTRGPRERSMVVKASIACWVFVAAFIAAVFWLPSPYKWVVSIPYVIVLILGITYWNRTQSRIRDEESGPNGP